ncbi:hypothetical protein B0H13DRAFT_2448045 [Mycena leptocephala]|nr:hypothetical protein B0H13DRAFT_2448045 [Mycena leptocephala]
MPIANSASSMSLRVSPSSELPAQVAASTSTPNLVISPAPPVYVDANTSEIHKVILDSHKFTFRPEVWCGPSPPHEMVYKIFNHEPAPHMLSVLPRLSALPLAPLTRTDAHVADHPRYTVIVPPHSDRAAESRVYLNVDLDISDARSSITHHDPKSADVWASAYIESPEHLLFTLSHWHSGRPLRRGSVLSAPNAWIGPAIVVEQIGISACTSLAILELRMLITKQCIYLQVEKKHVAIDATFVGRATNWSRVTVRRVFGSDDGQRGAR